MLEQVTTAQFLQALWPQGIDGWLNLFTRSTQRTETYVDWADTIDQLRDRARDRRNTGDVWYSIATRHANLGSRRGGTADCKHISCLWADIDIAGDGHASLNLPETIEDAWKLLNTCPLAPSIVVNTGGGLHAYWLLAEPLEHDPAVEILDRWATMWLNLADSQHWHLDNVFNMDRVFRLPNTYNWKTGAKREVPIIHWQPELRYGLDDLEPYLPVVAVQATTEHVPWTGPPRPGDVLNVTVAATSILQRNGWTLQRTDRNGDQQWTRPGKDPKSGSSATYYAIDGHVTIWSNAIPGLDTRRPYDTFGLFTLLEHGGDFTAASQALAAIGFGTPVATAEKVEAWLAEHDQKPAAEPAGEPDEGLSGRVVFDLTFWKRDRTGQQWLIDPVLALGRSHALYAPAKGYKSLITLEWATAVATGRPILNTAERPPQPVLYVDFEQTEDDLWERLVAMGYGSEHDLGQFHYHLHPTIPTLDSWQGGMALLAHIDKVKPVFVIIDTVSRTISGEENSSDTIINLARQTFTPIKARGITSLRLDHAGKDITKGQRGTSAKNDDVDVVWQLVKTENGAILKATHRRISWVDEKIVFNLSAAPTRFTLGDRAWLDGTVELARKLDAANVPLDASTRKAREIVKAAGAGELGKETVLCDALKWRREQAENDLLTSGSTLGSTLEAIREAFGEAVDVTPSDLREAPLEAVEAVEPHLGSSVLPPVGSTASMPDPFEDF